MRAIGVVGIAALVLASCGSDDPDPDTDSTSAAPESAPAEATPDEAVETEAPVGEEPMDNIWGTVDDPLPAGTPLVLSAWDVTVGPTTVTTEPVTDGGGPPDPGDVFMVADMTATRTLDPPDSLVSFDMGVIFTVMGASRVEITDRCSTDEDVDESATVAVGGVLTGKLCAFMPAAEAEGAVWMVHEQGAEWTAYVAQQ